MSRPADDATVGAAGDDVPVRDAATVVLLRDGGSGLEVWLLTRVAGMAFAAGASVFPGGRVEAGDAELPVHGGDLAAMASRFDCTEATAHALLGAAARETFEESGVLLTVPPAGLPDAAADVEAGRVAFADVLAAHGLTLDGSALQPWSRWVTPAGEPRRYDTRFFVGALPADAVAHDLTSESSSAGWVSVRAAIEQGRRGERGLLPPTLLTLHAIEPYATVADVLAAAQDNDLAPIRPVLQQHEDGSVSARLPDGSVVPVRGART